MREINKIIIHCSATPEGREHDVHDIRDWHLKRGWKNIGYHYVIKLDGTTQVGRPVRQQGAHAYGHNADSIGICYIGGMTKGGKKAKDTRTKAQKVAMEQLVCALVERFGDHVQVIGHNEVSAKACPSFDVSEDFSQYRATTDITE